jgi:hypothetical protein
MRRGEISMKVIYYCPACGEETVSSDGDPDLAFLPGNDLEWTCPKCDTTFRILIEFYPIFDLD